MVQELDPDAGTVHRARGVRIGYVPQSPPLSTEGTLRDEIMSAFDGLHQLEKALQSTLVSMAKSTPDDRTEAEASYSSLLNEYEALGGYDQASRMEQTAVGVGLSSQSLDGLSSTASGGERTRAALARALLSNPDLLVMDEPTNYLDLQGLTWLQRLLSHYPCAFVVVSHDRYFLDRVVNQIDQRTHITVEVLDAQIEELGHQGVRAANSDDAPGVPNDFHTLLHLGLDFRVGLLSRVAHGLGQVSRTDKIYIDAVYPH